MREGTGVRNGGEHLEGAAITDFPASIDSVALTAWMDAHGLGSGAIEAPRQLAGGTQNILLRFRRAGRDYVLRRPPANPRPTSNRVMGREIRLLGALQGSAVPHPGLIAACENESVLGAVFYLMEPVDGFNPTAEMPARAQDDPAMRHRMGIELIDGLALLATVDHEAAGLGDFGRLDGFLERQVGRWADELAGYARFEGWSGPAALGDVAAVGAWLEAHLPARCQPGIIHGDYHIGNLIYGPDGGLLAIVDWEMATLGDPLVDLGRLLLSWPEDGVRTPYTMRVEPLDGFPTRAELIARYAERSGRDLAELPWFMVLSAYKLGLIFEGSHARAQAGLADPATGERLHRAAVALLDEARRIIATS
ncbi:phosphotransferase family protein [Flavisphingomonas formosensis]|uniref:phosphotransferase family protein n=1 Tax=Flavisphingomonas formosensis TaxID=861534 RepID=UPI001E58F87E|nr:phosphotransferase family protein [Sphingomonas formosensis]